MVSYLLDVYTLLAIINKIKRKSAFGRSHGTFFLKNDLCYKTVEKTRLVRLWLNKTKTVSVKKSSKKTPKEPKF